MWGHATGDKLVPQSIEESEDKFRAQFKNLPVPTYTWRRVGKQFVLIDYNNEAAAITKGRVAGLMGATAAKLYGEEPEILADFQKCFQEESVVRREMLYRFRTTGESKHLIVTYVPVPPDLVMVHTEDITVRKLAETALRESEERLSRILQIAPEAIISIDANQRVILFNKAAENIFGYDADDMIGRPLDILLPEKSVREHHRHIDQFSRSDVVARQMGERLMISGRRKNGEVFPAEASISKVGGSGREIFTVILRDVSEREQAEEALRKSEMKHRTLIESMSDGIVHVDNDSAIQFVNDRFCEITGYSREELLGRIVYELLVTEADRSLIREKLRLRQQGISDKYEMNFRRKSGETVWIEIAGAPFRDSNGEVNGSIGVLTDIMRRKEAEEKARIGTEQLKILSRQLMLAQENERRLIARELHDEIGQSLTALKINLHTIQSLQQPGSDASRVEESIRIIDDLVKQVQDLSLDLRPSLLDDLGLLAAVRWYLDRQTIRLGFTAQLQADPPEMQLAPDMETTCFRIIQEAVTNVARHGQARRIEVVLRQQDGRLELSVRDDGAGFDVQEMKKHAGLGVSLGLLGMQERAQLLGGRLEIDSLPGKGTEIRAVFPLSGNEDRPGKPGS